MGSRNSLPRATRYRLSIAKLVNNSSNHRARGNIKRDTGSQIIVAQRGKKRQQQRDEFIYFFFFKP